MMNSDDSQSPRDDAVKRDRTVGAESSAAKDEDSPIATPSLNQHHREPQPLRCRTTTL